LLAEIETLITEHNESAGSFAALRQRGNDSADRPSIDFRHWLAASESLPDVEDWRRPQRVQ
jgi:hypothetical protein